MSEEMEDEPELVNPNESQSVLENIAYRKDLVNDLLEVPIRILL